MKIFLAFLMILGYLTSGTDAHAYVWLQTFSDQTTIVTFGGNTNNAIVEFLDDASSGHVKCGIDRATGFDICQLYIAKGKRPISTFKPIYNRMRRDITHSNTNEAMLTQDGEWLFVRILSTSQIDALKQIPGLLTCSALSQASPASAEEDCYFALGRNGRLLMTP